MKILTDIGGTHLRFAVFSDSKIQHIEKYKVADFDSFEGALKHYCEGHDLPHEGVLRIATAGYEDDGVWKFVNRNPWHIDRAKLEHNGWAVEIIMNDFEAATWSLLNLECGDVQTLHGGDNQYNATSDVWCLIGPGTGLGLGYLQMGDKPRVQKTHGGHIPIGCVTQEQLDVVSDFESQQESAVVYENIVSGPGLEKLRTLYPQEKALGIFHEFFGLFAASVVVSGHAYGGLYLTGGVTEKLMEDGLFDLDTFRSSFCFDAVASVKRDLEATPIVYITDPTPAFKGLICHD